MRLVTQLRGHIQRLPAREWTLAAGGLLAALAFLAGRWSPARLLESESGPFTILLDLRIWLVLSMLFVVVSLRHSRKGTLRVPSYLSIATLYLCIALLALATTGLFFEPACSDTYCAEKAIDVFFLASYVALFFFLSQEEAFLEVFWFCVFVLSLILAFIGLRAGLALSDLGYQGLTVLSGGRNVFSRLLGVLAILALFFYSRPGNATYRHLLLGVFCLSIVLLFLTGSRGGTIASLAGMVAAVVLFRIPLSRLFLISCGGTLALVMLIQSGLIDRFLPYVMDRYVHRLLEHIYFSSRDKLIAEGIELWWSELVVGVGLGRFSEYGSGPYPHNFFVELLSETGVSGALIVLSPVAVFSLFIVRNWDHVDRRGIAVLLTYFVAAQVSGDVFDSRPLLLLPVMMAVAAWARRERRTVGAGVVIGVSNHTSAPVAKK